MLTVAIESDTVIWLYRGSQILGNLVWRSEDETTSEFVDRYQEKLVARRDIVNSYLLPAFLSDNIFAVE